MAHAACRRYTLPQTASPGRRGPKAAPPRAGNAPTPSIAKYSTTCGLVSATRRSRTRNTAWNLASSVGGALSPSGWQQGWMMLRGDRQGARQAPQGARPGQRGTQSAPVHVQVEVVDSPAACGRAVGEEAAPGPAAPRATHPLGASALSAASGSVRNFSVAGYLSDSQRKKVGTPMAATKWPDGPIQFAIIPARHAHDWRRSGGGNHAPARAGVRAAGAAAGASRWAAA